MEQTSVEFLVDKMLYIENEYDMKLITKSEYQAKRRDIIDQANKIFKQQIGDEHISFQTQSRAIQTPYIKKNARTAQSSP